jgi:hypothetical protein
MVTVDVHAKDINKMLSILSDAGYKVAFKERVGNFIKVHVDTDISCNEFEKHLKLLTINMVFMVY